METMMISPLVAGLAKTAGETPAATEFAGEGPVPGVEAFVSALFAQGLLAPEDTAPASVTAGGNSTPPQAQALPLARPAPAVAPALLRQWRPVPADATATVAERYVADQAEAGAAVELDEALGGLRMAVTAAADDGRPAARPPEAPPAPAQALAAALDAVPEPRAGGQEFANETAAGRIDGSHATPRASEQAAPAQAYAARHAALPLAEPELLAERLNQNISIMLSQHSQQARIAVTPPDLGPVDVRVVVRGDEATIQLAAPHAATREALEEALPRLRAAFAESGLALAHAGVFAEMPQRQQREAASGDEVAHVAPGEPEAGPEPAQVRSLKLGLVDAFV